jgi:serine/threonine protein kinase
VERVALVAASFDFQKRLGSGNFGEVWLAVDTGLDTERAVKLIPPSKVLNPQNFFQEAQLLKAAEHPNVVRVYETGEMNDGRLYVAMEYLPKGSVEDETKGAYMPLTRVKQLAVDALRGLEHAHFCGIIHRDLKPANVLVGSSGEGKVSDFGLAIPAGLDLKSLVVKDYAYTLHLAPEVKTANDYTVLTDIYAFGVTLYRLVNGDAMLPAMSPQEARSRALLGKFPDRSKYREFVPRPLRLIINKAMEVNPARRFQNATEMRHAIERVKIEKVWTEKAFRDRTEWRCGWNKRCYEVVCRRIPGGEWEVIVRKGSSRKELRRLVPLCLRDVSKSRAQQHSRRVLQDFVLGKIR